MEKPKSDENNEKTPQEKTVSENQKSVAIVDNNVEREIQNVLMTSENEQNEATCSWKATGQPPPQTEGMRKGAIPAKTESTSSVSVSLDVHTPPFKPNMTQVQENITPVPQTKLTFQDNSPNIDISQSSSLIDLFEGLEGLAPRTPARNQQSPPVTNQSRPQSPTTIQSVHPPTILGHLGLRPHTPNRGQSSIFTNHPCVHSPITHQPRAQSPRCLHSPRAQSPRNPEPPTNTSRGIHVVNIPNDSINLSLQRANDSYAVPRSDQVLGPPPSYSKCLLDRRVNACASIQFVAPIPPPSYDGMENELRYAPTLGQLGGFTLGLGRPTAASLLPSL